MPIQLWDQLLQLLQELDLTPWKILAVVGVGVVAGFINTVAGSGSLLTLPLLMFLGLPANVANGTNRIAILLQNVVGVASFKQQKVLDFKQGLIIGLPAVAGSLLGASIGFLVYNFNPATIFMGDTGSLFLGFMLASAGIKLRFPDNTDVITWMVPVIVLGVPIFDTTLVVFSRIRRGMSPATPGKDHTSHRLVRIGFTQREAVMLLYLISGMLGMVAVFVTQADFFEAYLLGGSVFLAGSWGLWRMEKVPLD